MYNQTIKQQNNNLNIEPSRFWRIWSLAIIFPKAAISRSWSELIIHCYSKSVKGNAKLFGTTFVQVYSKDSGGNLPFSAGFSILSGVEILFFAAKFFFSLSKTKVEVMEARRDKGTWTGAEPEDSLQLEELNINK